ncbi:MAG: alpha/beta hydrolase [Candidatus Peregrinibacteria bacterium]
MNSNRDLKIFAVEFLETNLKGDILFKKGIEKSPDVLFLHGAGQSERKRFLLLRNMLLKNTELSSCSFDFIGHGETGGQLKSSSLQERTEQASTVIDVFFKENPLSIVAASMSAYTAIKLTERYKVDNLVLIVPAVYWNTVYPVKFCDGFSDMIRTPYSWKKTDAWSILDKFHGKVCVISAENDQVIPVEIISEIYAHAKQCSHLIIKDSGHQLLAFINNSPEALNKVSAAIAATLS